MICIIALIVFSILAIFSASYRPLAKEAFDCVFRKMTLRKCQTGLDTRIKSQVSGSLMRRHQGTARFVYKHFAFISWIFTISLVLSLVYTIIGGVNFYMYGNCNGPDSDSFCIFDPLGQNSQLSHGEEGSCPAIPPDYNALTLEGVDQKIFNKWTTGQNKVFFIGCYACPYTREAYSTIRKLSNEEDTEFVFGHLAVKGNTGHITPIAYCVEQEDSSLVPAFTDFLFSLEIEELEKEELIYQQVEDMGLIAHKVEECTIANETITAVEARKKELEKTNVYGTPTVFVNDEAVVGPKPYRVYKRLLK